MQTLGQPNTEECDVNCLWGKSVQKLYSLGLFVLLYPIIIIFIIIIIAYAATYTLSGRIGRVVVSHAAVARPSPTEFALIYTVGNPTKGFIY